MMNNYFTLYEPIEARKYPSLVNKSYGRNLTKISQIQEECPPPHPTSPPSHERFHKTIFRYFLGLVFNGPHSINVKFIKQVIGYKI